MSDKIGKQDLVLTRVFEAPVEQVWKLWTEPGLVQRWWGPDMFTCPVAKIDFRVGGTSLVSMHNPQFGENFSTWHYTVIVPLERIEYIHNLVDKNGNKVDPASLGMPAEFPQDVLNTVVFKRLGKHRTEMVVTEHDWPLIPMRDFAKLGLEQCLGKMAKALEA